MSTTADVDKSSGRNDNRLTHFYLGRDADGNCHHYSRQTELFYVISDDQITHTNSAGHPNAGTELEAIDIYREFVTDRTGGWDEHVILPMFATRVVSL